MPLTQCGRYFLVRYNVLAATLVASLWSLILVPQVHLLCTEFAYTFNCDTSVMTRMVKYLNKSPFLGVPQAPRSDITF